jgi:hypothetical protein
VYTTGYVLVERFIGHGDDHFSCFFSRLRLRLAEIQVKKVGKGREEDDSIGENSMSVAGQKKERREGKKKRRAAS